MDELLQEIKELKREVKFLNQVVKLYKLESQNDFKMLSNRLNDKLEELRVDIKQQFKKAKAKKNTLDSDNENIDNS